MRERSLISSYAYAALYKRHYTGWDTLLSACHPLPPSSAPGYKMHSQAAFPFDQRHFVYISTSKTHNTTLRGGVGGRNTRRVDRGKEENDNEKGYGREWRRDVSGGGGGSGEEHGGGGIRGGIWMEGKYRWKWKDMEERYGRDRKEDILGDRKEEEKE